MTQPERDAELQPIRAKLKELFATGLSLEGVKPQDIGDDQPLFEGGLGLDSLDAVEIVVLLQRHFGIQIKDMEMGRKIFKNVNTLAEYILDSRSAPAAKP
jgi:acyl carrier protein